MAAGEKFITGTMDPSLLLDGDDPPEPYETLSTRERQVLQLIAEGKTNRAIAEILGLSAKTVDTHRTRLMRKLDIHDQTSLVKFAIRQGVIRFDPE